MSVITPPPTPRRRRRERIRLLVLGIVAVLAVAAGTWAVVDWVAARAERCPGLDDVSGDGFALSKSGEQCIGWVVEHDYAFGSADQNVVSIISKITEENTRVRDQPGRSHAEALRSGRCAHADDVRTGQFDGG
jgi:hypothetical protein